MKSFKSRAKIANGDYSQWICGYYVESECGKFMYTDIVDDGITSIERFVVDKDTVGIQVPNLKDKNGKDIYTTDIVEFTCESLDEFRNLHNIKITGEVVYDETLYVFAIKARVNDNIETFDIYDFENDLEVIGNTVKY